MYVHRAGKENRLDDAPQYRQGELGAEESPPIWDLSSNEIFQSPSMATLVLLKKNVMDLHRYPSPYPYHLVAALAEHYGLNESQAICGPGSAGVLQQILLALCSAGDEVVYAAPCFDAYPMLIAASGAVGVPVALTPEGHHDLTAMLDCVGPRTTTIILCSPHNPTGLPVPRSDIEEFLRCLPSRVTVVVDEAYIEFDRSVSDRNTTLLTHRENLAVLRTFSKAYGLASLRVGYALTSSTRLSERTRKTAVPYSVTHLAELASVWALADQGSLRRRVLEVREARTELTEVLQSTGATPSPSQGN